MRKELDVLSEEKPQKHRVTFQIDGVTQSETFESDPRRPCCLSKSLPGQETPVYFNLPTPPRSPGVSGKTFEQ